MKKVQNRPKYENIVKFEDKPMIESDFEKEVEKPKEFIGTNKNFRPIYDDEILIFGKKEKE